MVQSVKDVITSTKKPDIQILIHIVELKKKNNIDQIERKKIKFFFKKKLM